MLASDPPCVTEHEGIFVVRDDLYPGGTKARFLRPFMQAQGASEYVYASPCEGGAQTSLCTIAREYGVKATIVVAKRAQQHARVLLNRKLGGKVIQVEHGYLNVVQAAAKKYAARRKAYLMPFGFDSDETIHALADAAITVNLSLPVIDEVWCASGSGTLARALKMAFPDAKLNVVQVGRELSKKDVAGAKIHVYPKPFGAFAGKEPPFPSDMNYDAKAWEVLRQRKRKGAVLMWNVMGPPVI